MLVYLSFLVCNVVNVCHITIPEERPFVGLAACQIEGEMLIDEWQKAHVGLTVTKVRCTMGKRPASDEAA